MTNATATIDAIVNAEQTALLEHQAGTCHLSQWSCSHCEDEAAVR